MNLKKIIFHITLVTMLLGTSEAWANNRGYRNCLSRAYTGIAEAEKNIEIINKARNTVLKSLNDFTEKHKQAVAYKETRVKDLQSFDQALNKYVLISNQIGELEGYIESLDVLAELIDQYATRSQSDQKRTFKMILDSMLLEDAYKYDRLDLENLYQYFVTVESNNSSEPSWLTPSNWLAPINEPGQALKDYFNTQLENFASQIGPLDKQISEARGPINIINKDISNSKKNIRDLQAKIKSANEQIADYNRRLAVHTTSLSNYTDMKWTSCPDENGMQRH